MSKQATYIREKIEATVVARKPDEMEEDTLRSKPPAPEAPRETARKAAKARWASWAGKKMV